jgi:hypothetical protein
LNADGKDDLVVYNAGNWMSTFTPETGFPTGATIDVNNLAFGLAGDIPVILDFDGDGHNDMGLFNQDDMEIGFNLYNSATKPDNHGYSKAGRGSYDATYNVPAGLTPTNVCAIKKALVPTGIKSISGAESNVSAVYSNNVLSIHLPASVSNKSNEIIVYNIAGQKVFAAVKQQENGQIALTLPSLNKGIYLVTVKNVGTAKLIVK